MLFIYRDLSGPIPDENYEDVMLSNNTESGVLSSQSQQPNIDLQIQFGERWAGCNTLLIEVAPHWLIVNDTGLDFIIIESNNAQWNLPANKAFAPASFEVTCSTYTLSISVEIV